MPRRAEWQTEPVKLTAGQLDGLVTWTLVRAAHRVERMLTELFASHGLTPTQFGVLATLAVGEPVTQADLARSILVRPQSMDALITGLVGRGLLVRTGRRGRGRPNPIALSRDGAELLAEIWPDVQAANDLGPLGLTEAQTAELNNRLHTVLRWTEPAPTST